MSKQALVKNGVTRAPRAVIGFGHPLLDILSHVDADLLKKYNVGLGSCNLAQKHQLSIFEELSQRRDVDFVPGGACMNTIRILKWFGGQLDNTYTFVGCLGDDEFGCILEKALVKVGVRPLFQHRDQKPTGTCACLIVDRERSLLANIGAARDFSMDFLTCPPVLKAVNEAEIFYCEGFFFNTVAAGNAPLYLGKHCAENNKLFSFNLSAPYLCHVFKAQWNQVFPYIDFLFGSIIDARAFAAANEWEETDLKQIMCKLVRMPKVNPQVNRLVVITNGSESTLVATKDEHVREFKPAYVPPEEIVDTNGAGDAFVGGFLSQIVLLPDINDIDIEHCVMMGHRSAAEVIRHDGCTFGDVPPS